MDLKLPKQQDTFDYTLTAASGERYETVFVIAGPTHPARESFEKKRGNRGLRDFNKRGKATLPDDIDELFELQTDFLVAVTLGWRELRTADGTAVPFTPAAARELYESKDYRWVRDAVSAAAAEAANFIKSSSPA